MDVRDEIMRHIKDNGISLTWLSKKTGIEYNALYAILKLKTTKLKETRLILINIMLKTNFKNPKP